MAKLQWDQEGQKFYEAGVSNGVLYVADGSTYGTGKPWNGLINVTESPSGAEATPLYADNIKYLSLLSAEEFGASIEAYTYPDEFGACDGSADIAPGISIGQQARKKFGMAYKTVVGNDTEGEVYGYKIHLIYGAQAAPSEKAYGTINDSPEAITFSWELTTSPVNVQGLKPTASLVIDSTKADPTKLKMLETILFGSDNADARLPLPDEISELFKGETPAALAVKTITPADKATAVPVNSKVVIEFNNKVISEQVTVISSDGVVVEGTDKWTNTNTTLTITPKSALNAATKYLVTIAGVSDAYGQSLDTVIKTFTTA